MTILSKPHFALLALACFTKSLAADAPVYVPDFTPQPPVPTLSPEAELKTIQLPPGYSLELVLSERDGIREPVNLTFDGNGRMYVAEMRNYMQDIDATGEHQAVGVVSRHESTQGDGHFDKHTIFADKLMLPREVLPLDDRVLINETDTTDIVCYQDTDRDGVADKKEVVFAGGPRGGNLEHQQSGLIWALDNWIYQSTAAFRLRWNHGGPMISEKCPGGGGQWGLAQDDYGKIWLSNAGGEKGLFHFQTPILYGGYDAPNQFTPDFMAVWPLVGLADFQSGPGRVRPTDKTLNHFSASCGQEVIRVDRLPQEVRGDVLISEPVGRLVRLAHVEMKDGVTTLTNPYGQSEFIRSTDPNFRIVNMANGPDGCIYLVDMYRGIIQEGNWTKPGSYLRQVILQYGMDKVVGHGRIWRLRHKDFPPGPQPKMLAESTTQLVTHLEHPNGWWRDTAQKLLVLKGDKSVVPVVAKLAKESKSPLARIHALWTLEGLDALDAGLVRRSLTDTDPQVRTQGIRLAERLILKGDTSFITDMQAMGKDKDPGVVLQTLMTGKLLSSTNAKLWPDYSKFSQQTMLFAASAGVKTLGTFLLTGADKVGGKEFSSEENDLLEKGHTIYQEVCFACHGFDGKGMQMDGLRPGTTIAPALAGSLDIASHRDAIAYILLNGITGPIGGKTYDAQMVSMNSNNDEWIAAVGSYVRNSFGNHGAVLKAADVKRIREETKDRKEPWTAESLHATLPQPLNSGAWKATASEAADKAALAIDNQSKTLWSTKVNQKTGQWLQVELPTASAISGVRLDQSKAATDNPKSFRVEVSMDGVKWTKAADANGLAGASEVYFTSVQAKFVKLTVVGAQKDKPWSVCELQLYAAKPAVH